LESGFRAAFRFYKYFKLKLIAAWALHNLLKYKAMNKKILIVDDNELIAEVMSYILTNNGYDVTTLYSGDGVVTQIKDTHPDLVIMDIMLPGIDGRDICRIIKHNKATENLPVIICSANDDIEDAMKQVGPPNDILSKPFDMSALLNKVELQLAA